MNIFDRYIFRNLLIGTLFVAATLCFIVFLTQSLRFLEIILEANSSGETLMLITALALPRFFEVILPLSLMTATLFVYNKMTLDSELVAIRAVGRSPSSLARPALMLAGLSTALLWINAMWVAPASLNAMQQIRLSLTAEFSNYLFREGVFNQVGNGLTVYIHKRASQGELAGLMIYDSRDKNKPPSTILARRGVILASPEGQQVVVYNGLRHQFDMKSKILQRLEFDMYAIDLPSLSPARTRWQEPDERTLVELLNPDPENKRDRESMKEFQIEIHRRITTPLLAFAFTLIALNALLLGETDRRGHAPRIILAVFLIVLLQSLALTVNNMVRTSPAGLPLLYAVTLLPIGAGQYLLSERSENFRRRFVQSSRNLLSPKKVHGA